MTGIVLMLLAGIPLALAIPATERRLVTLAGEAWLLGSGVAAAVLFVFSLVGLRWSFTLFAGTLAVIAIGAALLIRRPLAIEWPRLGWENLIDLGTLLLIGGFVRIATIAPPVETDYLTIWGLDAKEFWLHRGINWHFLATTVNPNAHVDYPLLVPLVYDVQALAANAWPEQSIGLITAMYGIAALLVVRGMLAGDMTKLARAASTAVLMPVVFSPFIGLAEGPLIAYMLAALLFIRRGNAPDVTRGAIYLGLAASCKNEGLALLIAVVVGMIVARKPRLLPRLWPALAIPLPWLIIVRVRGFTTDHLESGILDRLLTRLGDPAPIFRALLAHPVGRPLFWIGAAAACAIGWRIVAKSERFLAAIAILQPLIFISVYFITSRSIDWLVRWSWDRILRQSMPVIMLLALFCIMAPLGGTQCRLPATKS